MNISDYEIGRNLQRLRKEAGFKSARAFAECIGMKPTAYAEYEQGRHSLTIDLSWKIADALGCTLDALCAHVEDESEPEDPELDKLVRLYQNMNERGRSLLLSVAESLEKDVANRVVKNGRKDARRELA